MTWKKQILLSIAVVLVAAAALSSRSLGAYQWDLPAWVPLPREPASNPTTAAKVALGRHLFYDKRLSANHTVACATCHEQARAFTDGRRTVMGITGQISKRNSMSLANVAYLPTLTWGNPQIESLEIQALIPIFGEQPVEMGMAGKEALLFERLSTEPKLIGWSSTLQASASRFASDA
jgi:cytochrome c peroxidase